MWTIIVAVGAPILIFVGLPVLVAWKGIPGFLSKAVQLLFRFSISSPWAMLLTLAAIVVLIAAINWLMLRRAPVKPAK
jgi:hypothetical protein